MVTGFSNHSLGDVNMGLKQAGDTLTVLASKRYMNKYAVLWDEIPKSHVEALDKIIKKIKSANNISDDASPVKQHLEIAREIESLYEQAHRTLPKFREIFEGIARQCACKFVIGPLKNVERVIEKIEKEYNDPIDIAKENVVTSLKTVSSSLSSLKFLLGNNSNEVKVKEQNLKHIRQIQEISKTLEKFEDLEKQSAKKKLFASADNVVDIVRGSFVCENLNIATQVLDIISKSTAVKILRVKNGFKDHLKKGGYKDINLNVRVSNHVAEIQIHLQKYFDLKDKGHKIYADMRSLPVPNSFNVEDQLIGKTPSISEVIGNVLKLNMQNLQKQDPQGEEFHLAKLAYCLYSPFKNENVMAMEEELRNKNELEFLADRLECMLIRASKQIEQLKFSEAKDLLNSIEKKLPRSQSSRYSIFPHFEARVLREKARLNVKKGDYIAAYQIIKDMTIEKEFFGEDSLEYAESCHLLGEITCNLGDYEESSENLRKALDIRKSFFKDPQNIALSSSYLDIGVVLKEQHEFDKAIIEYKRALDIREKALGKEHSEVAACFYHIGSALHKKKDYSGALIELQKALQIYRKLIDGQMNYVSLEFVRSFIIHESIQADSRNLDEVLNRYKEALDYLKDTFGENHPVIAEALTSIGDAFFEKNYFEEALNQYSKALELRTIKLGESHPDVASSYYKIGEVRKVKGDFKGAIKQFEKAYNIWKNSFKDSHPETLKAARKLGLETSRCRGITKQGNQCSRIVCEGNFCWQHKGSSKVYIVDDADKKINFKQTPLQARPKNAKKCQGITQQGDRCSRNVDEGNFCWQHEAPSDTCMIDDSVDDPLCQAMTNQGKQCSRSRKMGRYCTQHAKMYG